MKGQLSNTHFIMYIQAFKNANKAFDQASRNEYLYTNTNARDKPHPQRF